jgi:hypothetical protein
MIRPAPISHVIVPQSSPRFVKQVDGTGGGTRRSLVSTVGLLSSLFRGLTLEPPGGWVISALGRKAGAAFSEGARGTRFGGDVGRVRVAARSLR